MPIKYAAIVPHPPLIIPQIGKDNALKMKQTGNAYEKVRLALVENEIETIVVVSSHGDHPSERLGLSVAEEFKCNFEDFGDFSTKCSWTPDSDLSVRLIEPASGPDLVEVTYNDKLDYGSAVPLYMLAGDRRDIKVIPLSNATGNPNENFELGKRLHAILSRETRRIAIIASGDLSHCLSKDSPGAYSPRGKKFDNKLVELLKLGDTGSIVGLEESFIDEAMECGLRSIAVLLGSISEIKNTPQLISYEAPFGVGYLVMGFNPVF